MVAGGFYDIIFTTFEISTRITHIHMLEIFGIFSISNKKH